MEHLFGTRSPNTCSEIIQHARSEHMFQIDSVYYNSYVSICVTSITTMQNDTDYKMDNNVEDDMEEDIASTSARRSRPRIHKKQTGTDR